MKRNTLLLRHWNEVDKLFCPKKRTNSAILVSKLQNDSHALREQADLKILRDHWLQQQSRYNQQFRKYDQEHRTWLNDAFQDADLLNISHDIARYRIRLEENGIEFHRATILPMMQLKYVAEGLNFARLRLYTGNSCNRMKSVQIVSIK
jgi:hypothetical protein